MRLLGLLAFLALCFINVASCKREYSLENAATGVSSGSIKTVAGDCMPSVCNGTFRKTIIVDTSNYIYVDVDVYIPGSYIVRSDTVNGLSFKGTGTFETKGIQTVRLNASGTPFTNGTVPYAVKFGAQKCIVNVFTTN